MPSELAGYSAAGRSRGAEASYTSSRSILASRALRPTTGHLPTFPPGPGVRVNALPSHRLPPSAVHARRRFPQPQPDPARSANESTDLHPEVIRQPDPSETRSQLFYIANRSRNNRSTAPSSSVRRHEPRALTTNPEASRRNSRFPHCADAGRQTRSILLPVATYRHFLAVTAL